MTDYDWQCMAHDLAVEVLGWEYDKVKPQEELSVYVTDESEVFRSVWKPWEDLNQAWRLFDALGNECDGVMFEVYSNSDATHWYAQASAEGHGYDNHKDPAKAIMLAVAKASELNLTDYEVEDG
jgi:hypothetical protein